jgi:hypothetical protein
MHSGQTFRRISLGLVVALTSLPALAVDDAESAASTVRGASPTKGEKPDRDYLHGGQFSLRLGFVGGYRINSRYDTSPYCQNPVPASSNDLKKFCGYTAPPALDLALGFAPLSGFEPFAFARLGLTGESETDTKPLVALGVGARLYTANDSAFKFFIQPAVAFELEKGQGHANWNGTDYKQDLLIQLLAGPQYDFSRLIGVYAGLGISAGMFRAIQTWMEYDFGVQFRLPG